MRLISLLGKVKNRENKEKLAKAEIARESPLREGAVEKTTRRKGMKAIREYLWISAIALGLSFLAIGVFFVVMGFEAKATIRTTLPEENVTTSADAVEFGVQAGILVSDARTAEAQAEVIKMHSIDRDGLSPEMEKDDPNRATSKD